MRKSFGARVLTFVFVLTLCSSSFIGTNVYAANRGFTDVNTNEYYYNQVLRMYDSGIVNGYFDGTFGPTKSVSHAEALKMICSNAGVTYDKVTGDWYAGVAQWAEQNGIIVSDSVNFNSPATREEICKYISKIYKLTVQSDSSSTVVFSDVTSNETDALVDTMVKYKVISGIPMPDKTIIFGGSQNVKRADLCIMLCRLSDNVQKPVWENIKEETLYPNVNGTMTSEEIVSYCYKVWGAMISKGDNQYVSPRITYTTPLIPSETEQLTSDLLETYFDVASENYLVCSFYTICKIKYSQTMTSDKSKSFNIQITFLLSDENNTSKEEIDKQIEYVKTESKEIIDTLYSEGKLNSKMATIDRARVLYQYVDYLLNYDTSLQKRSCYEALTNHSVVCQGYAALYAYLCNLDNIPMEYITGVADGVPHAWCRIYVGDTYYHCDPTYGDPVPDTTNYSNLDWFWVSENGMARYKNCFRTW